MTMVIIVIIMIMVIIVITMTMVIIVIITTMIIVNGKPVHSSTSTQRGTEANRSHSRPAIVSKCHDSSDLYKYTKTNNPVNVETV